MSRSSLLLLLGLFSGAAGAGCGDDLANKYGVHVDLAKAVAAQESGFNNHAINTNSNGSRDVCMMQVNSSWFPKLADKFGFTEQRLRSDPCACVEAGLWIFSENVKRYGMTWEAVGAYNARDPEKRKIYAWKIFRRVVRNSAPGSESKTERASEMEVKPYHPVLVVKGEGYLPEAQKTTTQ